MEILEILNTIRDRASAEYAERIPEATRDNIEEVRAQMLSDDNVVIANEFMSTFLNKIVKQHLIAKMFSNPLKSLKKGTKPIGDTVEEIYNNFLKGTEFDPTGENLLKRHKPDTKVVYHRTNYDHQYPVTVDRKEMRKAFQSYENLDSYLTNIVQTLYNSAELDEFANMKQILKSAMDNNAIKKVTIADPLTSKTNGEKFIKSVKTVSGLMRFPSSDWNSYMDVQSTDDKPIITFSRPNEQVLIIDTATDTSVSVDVLANTFNMSVADFNDTRKIVIDVFPDPNCRAVLIDEQFMQVFDDFYTITSFDNPKGIYKNYYLTVEQTLAYSILVNAVAFVVGGTTPTNE